MNETFDVINFHLTETCNYICTYCFAKFNNSKELKLEEWISLVDKVYDYFQENNIKEGRINLAGGEPLLLGYLDKLIDYIYSKKIKVSIISNGSLLTANQIDAWSGKVDTLGISIDSVNDETNRMIGRHSKSKTLDLNKTISLLEYAKSKHIRVKINTVVSKLNLNENLNILYERFPFDRIKLLQIRINKNCNESSMNHSITFEEFNHYCSKVNPYQTLIVESEQDIECAYIVIDPQGYLVTNKNGEHQKVGQVIKHSLQDLILQAGINYKTFSKRYKEKEMQST